jgi:hypothetical protein
MSTDKENREDKALHIGSVSTRFTIEEVKKMFFDAIQIGNGYIEDTHYPDVDADIAEREWQDYIKENNVC